MRNFVLFIISYVLVVVLTPIVFILNSLRLLYRKESLKTYYKICAIGFDQAGGSVLYSKENFTISSYTYFLCTYKKNKYACWFMKFIDMLFGKNHCKNSYKWEVEHDKSQTDILFEKLEESYKR